MAGGHHHHTFPTLCFVLMEVRHGAPVEKKNRYLALLLLRYAYTKRISRSMSCALCLFSLFFPPLLINDDDAYTLHHVILHFPPFFSFLLLLLGWWKSMGEGGICYKARRRPLLLLVVRQQPSTKEEEEEKRKVRKTSFDGLAGPTPYGQQQGQLSSPASRTSYIADNTRRLI